MVYRDSEQSHKHSKLDPFCMSDFIQIRNMSVNLDKSIKKWESDKSDENYLDLVDAAKDLGAAWSTLMISMNGGKEILELGHTLALVGIQDDHNGRFASSCIKRLDQLLAYVDCFLYNAKQVEKN